MKPRAVTTSSRPAYQPWYWPSWLIWATSAAEPVTGLSVAVVAVDSAEPAPDPCGVFGVTRPAQFWPAMGLAHSAGTRRVAERDGLGRRPGLARGLGALRGHAPVEERAARGGVGHAVGRARVGPELLPGEVGHRGAEHRGEG